MDSDARPTFRFAGFMLDLRRGSLREGNRDVELRPKSFEVLRYLVEHADRLVSKDELIAAVWPNVTVTDESLTRCISDVRIALADRDQRIIKTMLRRGYRFVASVSRVVGNPSPTRMELQAPLPVPEKPSIAVMPFQNMSGEPDQEYFADGIVEEIITALSRVRWLFLIARNSTFTYKGGSVDVKQVGRALGVRYVLEGSVRRAGGQIRITAQLIDVIDGSHLWTDRFDSAFVDAFSLQDQVAARVAGAIEPKLRGAEVERTRQKPIENLEAYDLFLRAWTSGIRFTREGNQEAIDLLYRAIELDPQCGPAYGLAAFCHLNRLSQGWFIDLEREREQAVRLARLAAERGKNDATALLMAGSVIAALGCEPSAGMLLIDRALLLNPNFAPSWNASAFVKSILGDHEGSLEDLRRAKQFSPLEPFESFSYWTERLAGMSYFFLGRHEEADTCLRWVLLLQPNSGPALRYAAANAALAGDLAEAGKLVQQMRELSPDLRISDLKKFAPRQPDDEEKYFGGLRKAGMPE